MHRTFSTSFASLLYLLVIIGCLSACKDAKEGSTDTPAEEIHLQHVADTISLKAQYAVLMDMTTGDILYGKNMDARTSPASLTKMMTCILAVEHGNMTERVTLGDTCLNHSYYFETEQTWTLQSALQEMMMLSDNGTAYAIANRMSSPDTSFINMMNLKAKALKLKNTHFMNPVGFYDSEHYSSARDMAILARYCMQNEQFRKIVGIKYDTLKIERKTPFIDTCKNTNDLLHDYPGCIGIKTGHIQKAGFCIAAAATCGDRTLLAVVMKTPDRETRNADARRLLDEGFKLKALKPGEKLPEVRGIVTPLDTADTSAQPKTEVRKEKPNEESVADSTKKSVAALKEKIPVRKKALKRRQHKHNRRHHRR